MSIQLTSRPAAFSPTRLAESIRSHAFPITKRGPAQICHTAKPWDPKGSRCPVLHSGEVFLTQPVMPEELEFLSTPEGVVQFNQEGIEFAIERRVALFFQQAILCHKMSMFTFSARGADDQIGTSPALTVKGTNKKSITLKREAAHSSTIPTLYAHAKDGSTPDGFVYLKGGSYHAQHNATVGMSEYVNGADELIDGNGTDGYLRSKAVAILNKTADGLDPISATQKFIRELARQVERVRKKLLPTDPRKLVLDQYQIRIAEIREDSKEKGFFDPLVGIVVDSDDPDEGALRKIGLEARYQVIRLQEVVESRIGKRISDLKAKLKPNEKSLLENALLKAFSEQKERKVLEKLLCKSAAVFEETYFASQDKCWKTFQTRVSNFEVAHKKELRILMRDLRADFRELIHAELSYRAGMFRDLRVEGRKWTQIQFCNEYLRATGHLISQSWVSRMEQLSRDPFKAAYETPLSQRRRLMSITEAKNCAKTFGVDPGLFLPCLITSED